MIQAYYIDTVKFCWFLLLWFRISHAGLCRTLESLCSGFHKPISLLNHSRNRLTMQCLTIMQYTFTMVSWPVAAFVLLYCYKVFHQHVYRNYCDSTTVYYTFSIGRAWSDYATSRVVSKHCRAKTVSNSWLRLWLIATYYIAQSAAAEVQPQLVHWAGTSPKS